MLGNIDKKPTYDLQDEIFTQEDFDFGIITGLREETKQATQMEGG